MSPPKRSDSAPILTGWKDIANYLGMGVRTAQRYELQFGLPIRRPAGKERGSVVATKAELDAWVNASPILQRKLPEVAALGALKAVLADHHRLRKDMARFREEMRTARERLRESVEKVSAGNDDSGFTRPSRKVSDDAD